MPSLEAPVETPSSLPLSVLDNPLISIIMPAYKAEAFIGRAIQSIINQDYQRWELVIVVDGSPDNTAEVAKSFSDERIKVIEQENQGVSTARNNAIAASTGEYIAFLDADDVWYPSKLDVDLQVLRQHKDPLGFVYGRYSAFDEQGDFVNFSPPYEFEGDMFMQLILCENIILPSIAFMHRSIVEGVGGMPLETDYYHEDWLFFMKIADKYKGYPTKQRLTLYQQSMDGKCRGPMKTGSFEEVWETYVCTCPELEAMLNEEQSKILRMRQIKTLFCSCLMYDRVDWAKKLYEMLDPKDVASGVKGKLALLSMKTGFNWMSAARRVYQGIFRTLLKPWWTAKTAWAFKPDYVTSNR